MCMLELGEEYCFTVQAVNAAGMLGERRRSNGVKLCGPPTAGTVTEIGPLPVPPESTFFGVFTVYSNEPDGVLQTPQILVIPLRR
jgi:hypothetical protein